MFKKYKYYIISILVVLVALFIGVLAYSFSVEYEEVKEREVMAQEISERVANEPLFAYKSLRKLRQDYADRITQDVNKSVDDYMTKEDTVQFMADRGFNDDFSLWSHGVYFSPYHVDNGSKDGRDWSVYCADGYIIAESLSYNASWNEKNGKDIGDLMGIYFVEPNALATIAVNDTLVDFFDQSGVLVKAVDRIDYDLLCSLSPDVIDGLLGEITTEDDTEYINNVIKEEFGVDAIEEAPHIYHSLGEVKEVFGQDATLDSYMSVDDTIKLLSDREIYGDELRGFEGWDGVYITYFNPVDAYYTGWDIISVDGKFIASPSFYNLGRKGDGTKILFVEDNQSTVSGFDYFEKYFDKGLVVKVVDKIDYDFLDHMTVGVLDVLCGNN